MHPMAISFKIILLKTTKQKYRTNAEYCDLHYYIYILGAIIYLLDN